MKLFISVVGLPFSGKSSVMKVLAEEYKERIAILDNDDALLDNWNFRTQYMIDFFQKQDKEINVFNHFFLDLSKNRSYVTENDSTGLGLIFNPYFPNNSKENKFIILILDDSFNMHLLEERYKKSVNSRENEIAAKFNTTLEEFFKIEAMTRPNNSINNILINNSYFMNYNHDNEDLIQNINYVITTTKEESMKKTDEMIKKLYLQNNGQSYDELIKLSETYNVQLPNIDNVLKSRPEGQLFPKSSLF
jgi:predicted lactoylglutathione lyase